MERQKAAIAAFFVGILPMGRHASGRGGRGTSPRSREAKRSGGAARSEAQAASGGGRGKHDLKCDFNRQTADLQLLTLTNFNR